MNKVNKDMNAIIRKVKRGEMLYDKFFDAVVDIIKSEDIICDFFCEILVRIGEKCSESLKKLGVEKVRGDEDINLRGFNKKMMIMMWLFGVDRVRRVYDGVLYKVVDGRWVVCKEEEYVEDFNVMYPVDDDGVRMAAYSIGLKVMEKLSQ